MRRDGREVYARSANRELLAIPLLPSEHSAAVGKGEAILTVPDALAVTVNGDGTLIVSLEEPYAASQTLRVLTHWEQRLAK